MSEPAPTRLILGPFNRVEGDLEVHLDVHDGHVQSARVNAPMFRGFETMLHGRAPADALTIVPRICGICSVSQSIAASRALADAAGLVVPPNGLIAQNLMLACENLADHLTHFYLFFMPDFTRETYAGRAWHAEAVARFSALASARPGRHATAATAARARFAELMGTLGGKWPHTGSVSAGGSTRAIEPQERLRLAMRLAEMRVFAEETLFGASLEEVAALDSEAALRRWGQGNARAAASDLRLWLDISDDLTLHALGRGPGLYLSHGAYLRDALLDEPHAFARGVYDERAAQGEALRAAGITEDSFHAWLADSAVPLHPSEGQTVVDADKARAYTWNKAPRLGGRVVEVGALARQAVDGHALARDLVARGGGNVHSRVVARLLEIARILILMEQWLRAIEPRAPYHAAPAEAPREASGAGLSEAARGALGHWLRIEAGRIANYQIIAPTSWNFSPRDRHGTPGALDAALVGAPVDIDRDGSQGGSVAVQHIVRSFDPCMVCTVH